MEASPSTWTRHPCWAGTCSGTQQSHLSRDRVRSRLGKEGGGAGGIPGGLQSLPIPQLREGTTAAITPQVLSAEDEDSPVEEVTYSIQAPANGKVVLRSAPSAEVRRFTQAQINNGLILFMHQGKAGLRVP